MGRTSVIPETPTIDALVGNKSVGGVPSTRIITTDNLALQMLADGPLSSAITNTAYVTMDSLLSLLGQTDDSAGYAVALAYFLDHPTYGVLEFGNKTYVGSFEHTLALAACDKVLDLSGATFMPDTDAAPCLKILNSLVWIEQVTAIADTGHQLQESDPQSSSSTTTLTLANARSASKGDIVKLYAMDPMLDVNALPQVDTPSAYVLRTGETMMVGIDCAASTELILNGARRESTYGGVGYEGTIRVALYKKRSLKIIRGTLAGNPIGDVEGWRGWQHTEIVGFTEHTWDSPIVRDHYGAAMTWSDCWMPRLIAADVKNLSNSRVSTGLNRYGYGILPSAGTRGMQIIGLSGTDCRHLIDSGSYGVKSGDQTYELTQPHHFGVSYDTTITAGSAIGLSNAPWGCHHNVRGMKFTGCHVSDTYVGDDSGGLAIGSRGTDVFFDNMDIHATRNLGNLGTIRGGALTNSRCTFGWNGIAASCGPDFYIRDNRFKLEQRYSSGSAFGLFGGVVYPIDERTPMIIGDHHITLTRVGDFASPTFTIFELFDGAHVLIDGTIFVDFSDYDGTINVVEMQSDNTSIVMTEGSKIILEGKSSTGTVQRIATVQDNDLKTITSITRSGTTATATVASTALLSDGQMVSVVGAEQAEYNGDFAVTVVDATHFSYTVSGSPVTPATGGTKYRRYVNATCIMSVDYRHDTTNEAGGIDNFLGSTAVSWRRIIGGNVTRDTASFNYTPTADGFFLNKAVDQMTVANISGDGGFTGADIAVGELKKPMLMRINNTGKRLLRWDVPPLAIPPHASALLASGGGSDWTRCDLDGGEVLLFAGFVDLSLTTDQQLKKATHVPSVGWQWVITRFELMCQSGGVATGTPTGGLFRASSSSGEIISAATTWVLSSNQKFKQAVPAAIDTAYTAESVYFKLSAASGETAICDAYVWGRIV